MNGKEYLEQIKNVDIRIQLIHNEIEELQAMLEYQGINYDHIGSSPKNSYKEDKRTMFIYELMKKHNELVEQYSLLVNTKESVRKVITQLENPKEIEVLFRRYFMFQKISNISHDMHYSKAQVYRLLEEGEQNIEKILKIS